MVSKKKKKKKFFFYFSQVGKTDMVLGKKVAIFYWEWGQNSAPRDRQKMPWLDVDLMWMRNNEMICAMN